VGIANIWNIVWDNDFFHWAIVFVFAIAFIAEVVTVWLYWQQECSETATAIKFLHKYKVNQSIPASKNVRSWLREHLGTYEPIQDKTSKFILIQYPAVLARPIPRSSLRFVTTLCTALGILGTFYGIQEGLQGISLDTSNSEQLMQSSTKLLMGMKTAFSTSLMGLGSGSLFTLILFVGDTTRQARRNGLRKKLQAIATFKTTDNSNGDVAEALSLVAKNLTGLKHLNAESIGQAVGRSIAEQFTSLNQLSAQSIGQAVGQQMLPALKAIFQEQKTLRELQESQGQRVLETLINDLRIQVLEPIANRLDESATLTQQASQVVLNLHQELGGISQSLATSIYTIQSFQKETLVELQGFAHNLGDTLSQFQTETKGVLQQTAVEINRAVDQSIQGMTNQRTAFQESAEQAAATFRGIRGELEQALQSRAEAEQQMLQSTKTGIMQILTQANTAFQQQTHSLTAVGNQASELMNNAQNNLLTTLGNIDVTLTATSQTVQKDLTQFRQEYQANLQTFFVQQNHLLQGMLQQTAVEINRAVDQSIQGMTNQRTAFEASAEQAAATFRGIREELEKALQSRAEAEQQMLQSTKAGIIHILTEANRAFHEQTNTLTAVGNQASELMNNAQNNLLTTLGNIDITLTATRQTVQYDLTQFREQYQANLQAFFVQQNHLLEGTLGEQRDGLAEVVNNLDLVFQNEAQRRSQLSQEVDNSMLQIQHAAREVGQLVTAVGLNSSQRLLQLEELSRDIGDQVQGVRQEYRELSTTFKESLEAWQGHFEASRQEFFNEADSSMAHVCSSLLDTANLLVMANSDRKNHNE
jgi:hypothetical protein